VHTDAQSHWEHIYSSRSPDAVSWYRPHLELSLELIQQTARGTAASIIDVGGGESTLVEISSIGGTITSRYSIFRRPPLM